MTLRLTQTRTILQIPRVLPKLVARGQSTQINPITNATTGYKKAILNYQQRRNASASAGADRYQSSSSTGAKSPAFLSTPLGQLGALAVLAGVVYYGYNMMTNRKNVSKDTGHYSKAAAEQQAAKTRDMGGRP